jgi:hypothetical protein
MGSAVISQQQELSRRCYPNDITHRDRIESEQRGIARYAEIQATLCCNDCEG